jgi:hypothetical protein
MHSLFSLLCCHCGADAAPHTQQRFHGSDMSKGFRVSDRREAMLAWSHEVLFSFFLPYVGGLPWWWSDSDVSRETYLSKADVGTTS